MDMTCLFSATPQGGEHQALLEMSGSPPCALGVIIMKGTESTDRPRSANARRAHTHPHTHPPQPHAWVPMSTCSQRETNPWLLAAVTFANIRWERSVPQTGFHEVKTSSFSQVPTLLFRSIPSLCLGWMPTDRSKLAHMKACLHYQHSNKCADLRTKTWWNSDRDDPCADSMLEACKF